jgi:hypothetical protein
MPLRKRCKMAVRTMKGILQRRHTEKGEPNHSLNGEGHGRGEESGNATSMNSTAYGERNAIKVDTGTREISDDQ